MPKAAYPPLIWPYKRTDAKARRIARAVKDLAALRAKNPAAYRDLLKKHAHRQVRIVAG